MTRIKFHCLVPGFNPYFLAVIFIVICFFLNELKAFNSESECARFNASDSSSKRELILKDFTVIGNSAEEYLTLENAWNITGRWAVNSGCKIKVCDDVYLSGKCRNLEGNSESSSQKWLSAKCDCAKQCSCNDVHLRRLVCARAYHSNDGCNDCQAPYTELKLGSVDSLAEELSDKVPSILVRPGCKLQIYEEENLEGDSITVEGYEELDEDQELGSYLCECPTYEPETSNSQSKSSSDPVSLDIPQSLDDVIAKLREHPRHPGLLAAQESINAERSSKNAYVLVIGSSGAGKSSTINVLLRKPNVTVAGDHQSTTSEIIELRIPVPVPALGIKNSQLRIIDTPGLGDTRGVEKDAQFLATLDDYLSNHEELKTRIPNLVLVFHKLTDNRFDGESSRFVKVIRGLNVLRERITDENFSNVVFVFSHLCSVKGEDQRNPSELLLRFKEVIEKYGLFPKPTNLAVVENKGKENFLPMVMGNYLLPNQEYFPRNLLQKLDTITSNCNDTIGNNLIKTAFMSSQGLPEDLLVEAVQHFMVPSTHSKVPLYLNSLNANAFAVTSTEVSSLLQTAFNSMDASLKARSPESLEYLQRYLNLRNIRSRSDVPLTTLAKLELLRDLPDNRDNEVYHLILKNGLGLTAPLFPQNVIVGYGYNNLSGSILPSTPFNLDDLVLSDSGFMIPKEITCGKRAFETKRYILTSKTCKEGSTSCVYVFSKMFINFQFTLKAGSKASTAFQNLINSFSPFDQHDHENVDKWNKFFNDYGTHVVKSADIGGKIDFQFTVAKSSANTDAANFMQNFFDSVTDYQTPIQRVSPRADISHTTVFHGGNPAYHVTDLTKLTMEEARRTLKMWKKSLNFYPAVFRKDTELLNNTFQSSWTTESLKKVSDALSLYLNSNLKYVPPPPPTPDPKILEELERKRKEQEEELKKAQEKLRREREAEDERRRLAKLEEIRLEEEAKKREEERKRQAEEEERQRQKREKERQLELAKIEMQRLIDRLVEEARREQERREMEERNRIERERIERLWYQPPPTVIVHRRNSCLKEGTKILLADYSEKPVEKLEIGDVVLDMDLKPTRVLGVSYEFLLDQNFYGFDNKTFFFTDSHIFVGPRREGDYHLYTASTERLFAQNPLLKYLNVSQFDMNDETDLLHFGGDNHQPPKRDPVHIFKDPNKYEETTLIYFVQVDSPTGTYIAEGYVTRHEIPPMEHWPNTMPILFPLLQSSGMKLVAEMPYVIEAIPFIDQISDNVNAAVLKVFRNEPDLWKNDNYNRSERNDGNCKKLELGDYDLDEVVGKIFGNPIVADLGMELYGRSGSDIALYLDNPNLKINDCFISHLQQTLLHEMEKELNRSVKDINHQSIKS